MKYIVYGGSGFLGTAIVQKLQKEGHDIVVCDIRPPQDETVSFLKVNLLEALPQDPLLERPDVVINLAGKLIFGKWNTQFKKLIYDTRVVGTRNIVAIFQNPLYRPKHLVNASAVGIYGDHGEEEIREDSALGKSFLATVAEDWEKEALKAKEHGVSVSIFRNGHILGDGGLLKVLLPYYKWGIGGPLGNGKQWMPFIQLDDVVKLYIELQYPNMIVNAVSNEVVRNKEFSKTIARAVHRPHIFWIPKIALKILYGEFADEILVSQKVKSTHIKEGTLLYPQCEDAVKRSLA